MVGAVTALLVVAAAMLALTFLVKDIGAVAAQLAAGDDRLRSMGKAGIVVVGLFAPIVYVFRRLGRWLKDLLGAGPGWSGKEAALARRADELERRLDRMREDVARLDGERAGELARAQERVKELEAAVAAGRQAVAAGDAALDAAVQRALSPRATMTDAEAVEEIKRSPFFDPGIELPEGGKP